MQNNTVLSSALLLIKRKCSNVCSGFYKKQYFFLSFLMDVHLPVIILNAEQKGTGATFKPLMSKNFKLASKDKVFVTNLSCKSTM